MNLLNSDLDALRFILNSLKESIPLIPVNFQVLDDAFRFVKKDDKPGNLIYVPGKLEVIELFLHLVFLCKKMNLRFGKIKTYSDIISVSFM